MKTSKIKFVQQSILLLFVITMINTVYAHGNHSNQTDQPNEIKATKDNAKLAAFDIVHAKIEASDRWLNFVMQVSDQAGKTKPTPTGKLEGSDVFSYVWPTKINSDVVGFEADQGILSMAITSHPDFDDTPLFDENGDGNLGNDGTVWHSHWVVLVPDDACGEGALKVKTFPPAAPRNYRLLGPVCPF